MQQVIESSSIMLASECFLSVTVESTLTHKDAIAIAWGACLPKDQAPQVPFAASLNESGLPTIAADICFYSGAKPAFKPSLFTLSLNTCADVFQQPSVQFPEWPITNVTYPEELSPALLFESLSESREAVRTYILDQTNKLIQGRTLVEAGQADAGIIQLDEKLCLAISIKQIVLNENDEPAQVVANVLKRGVQGILTVGAQPIGFAYHLTGQTLAHYETHLLSQSLSLLAGLAEKNASSALAILVVGVLAPQDIIASTFNRPETTLMLVGISRLELLPKRLILSANMIDHNILTTLANLCLRSQLGINIKVNADMLLSTNYIGHLLLEVANDKLKEIREIFTNQQINYQQLGRTTNSPIIQINNEVQLPLQTIKENWQRILSDMI